MTGSDEKREGAGAGITRNGRIRCCKITHPPSVYAPWHSTSSQGGQCTRAATYRDDRGNPFCTQHSKEPATVMRKATGKLRQGMVPIETTQPPQDNPNER